MCANYSLLAGVVFGSLLVCDFESLLVSVFVSVFISVFASVVLLVFLLVESVAEPVVELEPVPDFELAALSFL